MCTGCDLLAVDNPEIPEAAICVPPGAPTDPVQSSLLDDFSTCIGTSVEATQLQDCSEIVQQLFAATGCDGCYAQMQV